MVVSISFDINMTGRKSLTRTTILVDSDILDILKSKGYNVSEVAREALNQKALGGLEEQESVEVREVLVKISRNEKLLDKRKEEIKELDKEIVIQKAGLLRLQVEKRKKPPRVQLVERFAVWFKIFEREAGPFSRDDWGLYPDFVYNAFKEECIEEGKTLDEVIKEKGKEEAIKWLHKASGFPLGSQEEEDDDDF